MLFSLFLTDRYILATQQIITQEEHLRYSFWSAAIFWAASKALAHRHNNRKLLKQPLSHFQQAIPDFWLFWCILSTTAPDILSSSESINSTKNHN